MGQMSSGRFGFLEAMVARLCHHLPFFISGHFHHIINNDVLILKSVFSDLVFV
jgi:hypothetical protein